FALLVIVVELNARAVLEWYEEAVARRSPAKSAPGQIEFFNDEWMEQSGEVSAGRHANAGPGFFDSASAADAVPALQDENAFSGAREIGRTRQAVVSGPDDERVPALVREFGNRGQAVRCCSPLLWSARAA